MAPKLSTKNKQTKKVFEKLELEFELYVQIAEYAFEENCIDCQDITWCAAQLFTV